MIFTDIPFYIRTCSIFYWLQYLDRHIAMLSVEVCVHIQYKNDCNLCHINHLMEMHKKNKFFASRTLILAASYLPFMCLTAYVQQVCISLQYSF